MLNPKDGRQTNTTGRAGKYQYPDDVKTQEQRKAFRRKARAALRAMNSALLEVKGSHAKDAKEKAKETETALQGFIKRVYVPGAPLVIDAKAAEEPKEKK